MGITTDQDSDEAEQLEIAIATIKQELSGLIEKHSESALAVAYAFIETLDECGIDSTFIHDVVEETYDRNQPLTVGLLEPEFSSTVH